MPDQDLRRLQRSARAGDVRASASLLRAKLRSGQIERAAIELAAHLADPLACEALGRSPAAPADLLDWTRELERWGRVAVVQAGLEAASLVDDEFARWVRLTGAEPLAEAYEAAHRWSASPCERGRSRVERRWLQFLTRSGARLVGTNPQVSAANAVAAATRAVFDEHPGEHAAQAVAQAARSRSPRAIHQAIRARLLPSFTSQELRAG